MADFFHGNEPDGEPTRSSRESTRSSDASEQVSRELRAVAGQLTRSIQQLAALLDRILEIANQVQPAWRPAVLRREMEQENSELSAASRARDRELAVLAQRLERHLSEAVKQSGHADEPSSAQALDDLNLLLQQDLRDVAARTSERARQSVATEVTRQVFKASSQAAVELAVEAALTNPASTETRRSLSVGQLPDGVVADLQDAEMNERHAHLDSLMQD